MVFVNGSHLERQTVLKMATITMAAKVNNAPCSTLFLLTAGWIHCCSLVFAVNYNKMIFMPIPWKLTQDGCWQDSTGSYGSIYCSQPRVLSNISNRYWKKEIRRKLYGLPVRLWVVLAQCIQWRLVLQGLLVLIEVKGPCIIIAHIMT